MNKMDMMLITGFLITEQERFYSYLVDCGFDGDESIVIIEELTNEVNSYHPSFIEHFSEFFGE